MNSIFINQRCAQDFLKLRVDLFLIGYRGGTEIQQGHIRQIKI